MEHVLQLKPNSDGRVVMEQGKYPPSAPIGLIRHSEPFKKKLKTHVWAQQAFNSILSSLFTTEPPYDAAKLWKEIVGLDADFTEKRRLHLANEFKLAKEQCDMLSNGNPSFASKRKEAEDEMVRYGQEVFAMVNRLSNHLAHVAESCLILKESMNKDRNGIHEATNQLYAACYAPLPQNAETEWRERIAEVIGEEVENVKAAKLRKARDACASLRERPPFEEVHDLVHGEWASHSALFGLVSAYSGQVDLHCVDILKTSAEKCAQFLNYDVCSNF